MHESEKIKEAEYFYNKLLSCQENSDHFKYNLSAFLTAARSVLQYAREEAVTKNHGQQWYDRRVSGDKVLSFFRDKRDVNIHKRPVVANRQISIHCHDVVPISDGPVRLTVFDSDGNVKEEQVIESDQPTTLEAEPTTVTYRYMFADWSGSEDVINLGRKYLDELKNFVMEGQSRGFLT